MEAMFQLRIDTVTVVKEISQISVVNNYSKAPDSGEAREVHLSSHVADGKKKKIINFPLRFATFWLHYICVLSCL